MVKLRHQTLFFPAWGIYDMGVGEKIVSVYAGPADAEAFGLKYPVPQEKTHKVLHTSNALKLHELYQQVSAIRNNEYNPATIEELWEIVINKYPNEWLLVLEIYELLVLNGHQSLAGEVKSQLEKISKGNPDTHKLINDGIQLLCPDILVVSNSEQ